MLFKKFIQLEKISHLRLRTMGIFPIIIILSTLILWDIYWFNKVLTSEKPLPITHTDFMC
jgi:hypothetical protein